MADLANLKLTEPEIARLAKDLDEILTHMDTLERTRYIARGADGAGAVRERRDRDAARGRSQPPLGNEAALANAPLAGAGYYKVPKVIER